MVWRRIMALMMVRSQLATVASSKGSISSLGSSLTQRNHPLKAIRIGSGNAIIDISRTIGAIPREFDPIGTDSHPLN